MATGTKRIAQVALGWTLVVLGVPALLLPGPGLLAIFAGLVLLSQQYEWARRRVEPAKRVAYAAAAEGVHTVPRILVSLLGIVAVIGTGVLWGIRPPAPGWWPLRESWWLFGGWATGSTLIISGIIGLVLLVYSWRRFGGPGSSRAAGQSTSR